MLTLKVSPVAIKMATDAYNWYENQQAGLGELFLKELDSGFERIENDPYHFATIKKQYRQLVLRRFPYVLVFEVLGDTILIISIFHTSRNPRKKFNP